MTNITPKPGLAQEVNGAATLTLSPEVAQTFNEGNALFRQAQWEAAEACYLACLELTPHLEAALLQLARCAVNQHQYKTARERFTGLLKLNPQQYSAWLEAGHLCRKQGVLEQAARSYQQALSVAPNRFEAAIALTRVLEELGNFNDATVVFERCMAVTAPDKPPMLLHLLGRYRLERGDLPRALDALHMAQLCALKTGATLDAEAQAELQTDQISVLLRLGLTDQALHVLTQAIQATAEPTLVRLSEALFSQNLWQEATQVLERNADLHPDSSLAHWNLAYLYCETWRMEEGLAALAKAQALAPQSGARSLQASVAGRTGDIDTALAIYQTLAFEESWNGKSRSSAAMTSLYSDQLTPQAVSDLHRELFAPLGQGARPRQSFTPQRDGQRRLKLGLVSADFHHQHPVNIFMQPVLARLDPKAFDVTVYFNGNSHDEQTELVKRRVHHWHEVAAFSDEKLARLIGQDEIDILIDLSGHTSHHRAPVFAQRAAPVQASFLGYPGSTGLPNMDWILTDPIVAPEGCESLFSEQVMRLPNTVFCFSPEAHYPTPNYTQAHAQRPLTFGSFNNVPKLTLRTIKLWAEILKQVPQSRLLLKAPSFGDARAVQAFTERFAAQGIGAERLLFRGPVGLSLMMDEYADVDIALDPVPYNGGTTTLQALWMGVPVVVQTGHSFVARMGASFMCAAGLSDWVANDDEGYVQVAVKMAKNRQALLTLKQGLRSRLQSQPAWDIDQYTQDFDAALRKMWAHYLST
jgi:protein O-GlcNAc transferase